MNNAQLNDRGQITIPKRIREKADLKPRDTVNIDINDRGEVVISKRNLLDDLDDLIKKDLVREGCAPYELEPKVVEKKKELANALLDMIESTEKEIAKGDYVSLDELKKELTED